ncbi:MAG TPA: hypothetical protein VFJ78_05750 [Gaiellaceae bacterium]|nr:hypothetical protein [Gaiellaceae bacterium]
MRFLGVFLVVAAIALSPASGVGSTRPAAHAFDPSAASIDVASALARQADGKLVLAGLSRRGGQYRFGLVRYRTNGTVDTSFGTHGIVLTAVGTNATATSSVVVQEDGKLVVGGGAYVSERQGAFALVRYNRRGALDASFGKGGRALTPLAPPPRPNKFDIATIQGLALQADGRIVAAGFSTNVTNTQRVALARYGPTGKPDTAFGNGGSVVTTLGSRDGGSARAVAVQRDGKIVVAGSSMVRVGTLTESRFLVARFTRGGMLDARFGVAGKALAPALGYWDQPTAVALQADGKIVVAGSVSVAQQGVQLGLARFLPNGRIDTGFGNGGTVLTNFAVLGGPALAVAPDGNIVVACGLNGPRDFGVGRYEADGTLDATFGENGKVRTRLPAGARATAVVLQRDGKIVAGGSSGGDFALARYAADGTLDTGFGNAGIVTTPLGPAWR